MTAMYTVKATHAPITTQLQSNRAVAPLWTRASDVVVLVVVMVTLAVRMVMMLVLVRVIVMMRVWSPWVLTEDE